MGEVESLRRALDSIPAEGPLGPTLIVLVLNARVGDPPAVHAANGAARPWLSERPDLLLIDRARPGHFLPEKEGVGLARKIGCDVALALIAAGAVRSRYIRTTDADAQAPAGYLETTAPFEALSDPPAALIHRFRHRPADWPGAAGAIARYELWLRAHRLALARARSPYAFQAIGSTLALEADALAAVRGFPRKMAGEDFYLLDKLAKLGELRHVGGGPIVLEGRTSDRVPFGTGRAMAEAKAAGKAERPRFLDPRGYRALAAWLAAIDEAGASEGARGWDELAARLGGRLESFEEPERRAVVETLEAMGVARALESAARMTLDARTWLRRMHTWFDAFRTLRFLHALRDRLWPAVEWPAALPAAGLHDFSPTGDGNAALALAELQRLDESLAPVAGIPPRLSRPGSDLTAPAAS